MTAGVLVLVCRRPRAGTGKRRLAAVLGDAAADELKPLLLDCALEDAARWPGLVVIAPDRASDAGWAQGLLAGARVLAQGPGNLGERINGLDAALRADGHERLFFIGSDAPVLDPALCATAQAALAEADAFLASADDGGVTLMAARRHWPTLAGLPWGSEALAEELAGQLLAAGWTVEVQPGGYDVDRARDLASLLHDLAGDIRPARRRLHRWLAEHFARPAGREPARRQWPGLQQAPGEPGPASVSIVIPVRGDLGELEQLLQRIGQLLPAPAEIIVVDGAADPRCARLCAEHGARYLAAGGGRGPQLRAGAEAASGRVLWFLHADAEPAADALAHIARALDDPAVSGGCFSFRFSGARGWQPRMIETLTNCRSSWGIPYGDQGLFARREAYEHAGGFAPEPLFEEVALVRGLRRAGRFVCLKASIGVSARRWLREGWLRRSLANRLLALLHLLGVPAQRLAAWYRARRR
ncbi:MAG: TIGR04283 family arsenosugar biosynthesis glycosyltransferase [Chromatiales bacterium]|nr:TIGR04283 family arsenosugar biosynthesis glycosyltransferase [Chromatiales bacterium]